MRLVGRTDRAETARWFKGASVFVLRSRHEPFGFVNVEAMAAGVPVVATRVGGVPEFVIDGEKGLLVPPESPDAMARALQHLLDDDALRQGLVANASKRVTEFRWTSIAGEYLDVYGRIPRQ